MLARVTAWGQARASFANRGKVSKPADTEFHGVPTAQPLAATKHGYGVPFSNWVNWDPARDTRPAGGERRGAISIEACGSCHWDPVGVRSAGVPRDVADAGASQRDDELPVCGAGVAEGLCQPRRSADPAATGCLGGAGTSDRSTDPLYDIERYQQGTGGARYRPGGRHRARADLHPDRG